MKLLLPSTVTAAALCALLATASVAGAQIGPAESSASAGSSSSVQGSGVVAGFSGMSHGTGANAGGAQNTAPSPNAKHGKSGSIGRAEAPHHPTGTNRTGVVTGQIRATNKSAGEKSSGEHSSGEPSANTADKKYDSLYQYGSSSTVAGKAAYGGAGTGASGKIGQDERK